jgi:phosphocarrier protein HPr
VRRKTLMIVNRLGLHARAAAALVQLCNQYKADATIGLGDGTGAVNAKSIMGVLTLAAAKGRPVELTTDGSDEEAAMTAISGLIAAGFYEDD